jgi:hypothetical protein
LHQNDDKSELNDRTLILADLLTAKVAQRGIKEHEEGFWLLFFRGYINYPLGHKLSTPDIG